MAFICCVTASKRFIFIFSGESNDEKMQGREKGHYTLITNTDLHEVKGFWGSIIQSL